MISLSRSPSVTMMSLFTSSCKCITGMVTFLFIWLQRWFISIKDNAFFLPWEPNHLLHATGCSPRDYPQCTKIIKKKLIITQQERNKMWTRNISRVSSKTVLHLHYDGFLLGGHLKRGMPPYQVRRPCQLPTYRNSVRWVMERIIT